MVIVFFFLMAALITIYSLAPLLRPRQQWLSAVDREEDRRVLEAEKQTCLQALKDIEFENACNKINDQDFIELKKHYGTKAARAIKKLEYFDSNEF